ncbi:MAG: hypothetical protein FWE80_03545, partial [Oscillospiraceae bacterium]|nr:hypothetical protein [Oscillospiraceae bacterium]
MSKRLLSTLLALLIIAGSLTTFFVFNASAEDELTVSLVWTNAKAESGDGKPEGPTPEGYLCFYGGGNGFNFKIDGITGNHDVQVILEYSVGKNFWWVQKYYTDLVDPGEMSNNEAKDAAKDAGKFIDKFMDWGPQWAPFRDSANQTDWKTGSVTFKNAYLGGWRPDGWDIEFGLGEHNGNASEMGLTVRGIKVVVDGKTATWGTVEGTVDAYDWDFRPNAGVMMYDGSMVLSGDWSNFAGVADALGMPAGAQRHAAKITIEYATTADPRGEGGLWELWHPDGNQELLPDDYEKDGVWRQYVFEDDNYPFRERNDGDFGLWGLGAKDRFVRGIRVEANGAAAQWGVLLLDPVPVVDPWQNAAIDITVYDGQIGNYEGVNAINAVDPGVPNGASLFDAFKFTENMNIPVGTVIPSVKIEWQYKLDTLPDSFGVAYLKNPNGSGETDLFVRSPADWMNLDSTTWTLGTVVEFTDFIVGSGSKDFQYVGDKFFFHISYVKVTVTDDGGNAFTAVWGVFQGEQPTTPTSEPTTPTQPTTDETEPTTDETEPTTDETEPTTDETQPTTDETEPTTDETEPTTDETEPTTDETEPTTDETEPTTDETEPTTDETQPTTDETQPTVAPTQAPLTEKDLKDLAATQVVTAGKATAAVQAYEDALDEVNYILSLLAANEFVSQERLDTVYAALE